MAAACFEFGDDMRAQEAIILQATEEQAYILEIEVDQNDLARLPERGNNMDYSLLVNAARKKNVEVNTNCCPSDGSTQEGQKRGSQGPKMCLIPHDARKQRSPYHS